MYLRLGERDAFNGYSRTNFVKAPGAPARSSAFRPPPGKSSTVAPASSPCGMPRPSRQHGSCANISQCGVLNWVSRLRQETKYWTYIRVSGIIVFVAAGLFALDVIVGCMKSLRAVDSRKALSENARRTRTAACVLGRGADNETLIHHII